MVNDVLTMILSTINYPLSSITIIIIDHDFHHDFHVSTVSASFWADRCCACVPAHAAMPSIVAAQSASTGTVEEKPNNGGPT